MADTLESLELEVKHSASGAGEEINKLSSAISALKSSLSGVPTLMKDFASAINGLGKGEAASKIKSLAEVLDALGNSASTFVGFISLESLAKVLTDLGNAQVNGSMLVTLARGLDKLSESIKKLNGVHTYDLNIVANALAALGGIDFSGLASVSFTKLANGIASLAIAATSITQEAVDGLRGIAIALGALAGIDFANLARVSLTGLSNGIARLATALKQLAPDDIANLRNLSSALNGIDLSNLGDVGNLTGVAQAAKAMHSTAKGVRKVGDEAKKAKGPIDTFLASIKRIAFYRMLRTIIKEIGQAFSEGLNKAYLFSSGITTEGHRFAEAMDSMKSATTQMKNQLGAAFIALLTSLEPIITALVNLVTKAADAISQLISAFTGTTYLRAATVSEKFADSMDAGAKSAKEWKNQLLGFDVINRLNDNSGGSTGLLDEDAFVGEDAPIDDKWLTIAEKIKGIGEKFKELINSLNFEPVLEGWNNLKESVSGLYDTVKNGLGWAWDNILVPLAHWTIEEAAPVLLNLLASAFSFLNSVFEKLAPILQPLWENVLKPFFASLGNIVLNNLEELAGLLDSITQLINGDISWQEFWNGLSGTQKAILLFVAALALYKVGSILISAGSAFISFGKGVADGITKAGQAASSGPKVVKALKLTALGIFDAVMIAYDVQSFVSAAKEYRKAQEAHTRETETALENYKRVYDEKGPQIANSWAETVYGIKLSGDDLELNQSLLADHIEGFWADVPQNMWDGFRHGWDYYFVNGEGGGLLGLIGDAFQGVIDWVKKILGIHSPSTVFEEIGIDLVKGLWNGFSDTWGDFTGWLTDAWNDIAEFFGLNPIEVPITIPEITYQETGEVFGPFIDELGNLVEEIIPDYVYNIPGVTHKAAGGFVDSGELFLARESGPELVGSVGGRSAVANNDQIVEAVSAGVYQAVSSAMGGSNKNISVHVYLDSREIKSGQQRLARAVGG